MQDSHHKCAELINKTPSYYPCGPFPLADIVGMGLAVDMELKSLVARGRIREHVQSQIKNWESFPLGGAEGALFDIA